MNNTKIEKVLAGMALALLVALWFWVLFHPCWWMATTCSN